MNYEPKLKSKTELTDHQWGLDNYDLLTMPPALLDGFSTNDSSLSI